MSDIYKKQKVLLFLQKVLKKDCKSKLVGDFGCISQRLNVILLPNISNFLTSCGLLVFHWDSRLATLLLPKPPEAYDDIGRSANPG